MTNNVKFAFSTSNTKILSVVETHLPKPLKSKINADPTSTKISDLGILEHFESEFLSLVKS